MTIPNLKNISLTDVRKILKHYGCKKAKSTGGGHEKWVRADFTRPITIQSHISPVPEFIIQNTILKTLKVSKKEFFSTYKEIC